MWMIPRPVGNAIDSAEFNVNGGTFTPMDAVLPPFDAVSENVTVLIPAGTFTEAGVNEVCVRGTDAIGNIGAQECIFLVVFDPSGGFVTGGGWISS